MALQRETYYSALYERLQAKVSGIQMWSRKDIHYAKIPSTAQPALLLLVTEQVPDVQYDGLPTSWSLNADVVVLVSGRGMEDGVDPALNEYADQIEAALEYDETLDGVQDGPYPQLGNLNTTLGGLVQSCHIGGPVVMVHMDSGDQCWVMVPVEMIVHAGA